MAEEKKTLQERILAHADFEEPNDYSMRIVPLDKDGKLTEDPKEAVNPRLIINVPANKMFIEITNSKPAYMIVVSRADQELNSLGLLEKAKDMVKAFCATLDMKRHELTRGVREAHALLAEKRRPS